MVVGIFTDTFYPEINGVATSVMLLKRELERLGHKVHVITCSHPTLRKTPDILNTHRLPSAPFIFLPSRRLAVIYNKSVARRMRLLELDIVHTNTEFSLGMFGKLIATALDIPVVHTYHTLYEDYVHYITRGRLPHISTEFARRFSRVYCNSCSTIVTPTEKTRDLLQDYNVTRPVRIVPTGVDIGHFTPAAGDDKKIAELRSRLGIMPDDKVVLYVGRLAKEKSVDEIVRNLSRLFYFRRDIKFLMVGDGPWKAEIESIGRSCGISDRLVFAGEQPWSDIPLYYRLGDVFISASLSETQGLTFIEAMAAGLPVLAKRDRSIENLIRDGFSGCLFDEGGEIPDKLLRTLTDDGYRERLICNAMAVAAKNSAENFGTSIEKVYRDTLYDWEALDKKYVIGKKVMKKILL